MLHYEHIDCHSARAPSPIYDGKRYLSPHPSKRANMYDTLVDAHTDARTRCFVELLQTIV